MKTSTPMPIMLHIRKAVIFGGEKGEGLRITEKIAAFAESVLVVPSQPVEHHEIVFSQGRIRHGKEPIFMPKEKKIPLALEPASITNLEKNLEGKTLIISALEDQKLNLTISQICKKKNILCDILDKPELSSIWMMSLIHTPSFTTAFSTNGKCAFYSVKAREDLEESILRHSEIAKIFSEFRLELKRQGKNLKSSLEQIYSNTKMQKFLEKKQWSDAYKCGLYMISKNYTVKKLGDVK